MQAHSPSVVNRQEGRGVRFTWARLRDIPRLLHLACRIFPDHVAEVDYHFRRHRPTTRVLWLDDREEPRVGFWILNQDAGAEAWLELMGLEPEVCGRGLGRALLDDFLERCTDWGYHIAAHSVREDNETARALYRKSGFEEVQAFVENGAAMVCMKRPLDARSGLVLPSPTPHWRTRLLKLYTGFSRVALRVTEDRPQRS